jgi:Tol biopolymer transport system component
MSIDGSNQINLTNNSSIDYDHKYSPDGSKIAFRSTRDGNFEIYTMALDGSDQKNITNSTADEYEYQFSPDGSKIVYISLEDISTNIYLMNSDGSNKIKLLDSIDVDDPVFSPDGAKICYVARPRYTSYYNIYIMNIDGSNPINLTNNPNGSDHYPQFSFDGSQILFISDRDKHILRGDITTEIYCMNSRGTNQKNLSNNLYFDQEPVFQPHN